MRNAFFAAGGFLLLFALCFHAKVNQKPSQPKPQPHNGLIEFIIPLMQYYDSRSATGLSYQPMPRYVFEFREGGCWQFMSKFPDALNWHKTGRLRFASMNFKCRADAVWFANSSYVYFKNNPPIK